MIKQSMHSFCRCTPYLCPNTNLYARCVSTLPVVAISKYPLNVQKGYCCKASSRRRAIFSRISNHGTLHRHIYKRTRDTHESIVRSVNDPELPAPLQACGVKVRQSVPGDVQRGDFRASVQSDKARYSSPTQLHRLHVGKWFLA